MAPTEPTLSAMGPDDVDDGLRQLGQLLWRYRQHLENVEYLLTVQHLVVSNAMERWLARTADQLRQTIDELAGLDAERVHLILGLGPALGLDPQASLRELADRAPEPWGGILTDHVQAFSAQLTAVSDSATRLRSAVNGGLDAVHDLMRTLTGAAGAGYDAGGRPVAQVSGGSLLFDGQA